MPMNHANEVYRNLLDEVEDRGFGADPRGMFTKEIIGHTTRCDMSSPIVTIPERELGYKFMFAEAHWILSGDNRVSTIKPYSNVIKRFSDDGVFYFGAYGPKVVDQLPYICKALNDDIDTRQACINIWREKPPVSKDVPCTLSLQFLVRRGTLYVIANMRSNDVWLGWPYDNFNFSMIGLSVCLLMKEIHGKDLKLGMLTNNAGSRHLYKENFEKAFKVVDSKEIGNSYPTFKPENFNNFEDLKYRLHAWKDNPSEFFTT